MSSQLMGLIQKKKSTSPLCRRTYPSNLILVSIQFRKEKRKMTISPIVVNGSTNWDLPTRLYGESKLCCSSCTPMWVWMYSREFDFSTDGALVDAWPYFPGIKVGKIISILSFWLFLGFDYKSLKRRLFLKLGCWLELFSLAIFV
jgi:hypothetical protein